jgi:hypothetical protein
VIISSPLHSDLHSEYLTMNSPPPTVNQYRTNPTEYPPEYLFSREPSPSIPRASNMAEVDSRYDNFKDLSEEDEIVEYNQTPPEAQLLTQPPPTIIQPPAAEVIAPESPPTTQKPVNAGKEEGKEARESGGE